MKPPVHQWIPRIHHSSFIIHHSLSSFVFHRRPCYTWSAYERSRIMYKALNPWAVGVKLPIEQCVPLAKKNGFEGIYFDVRWAAQAGPERNCVGRASAGASIAWKANHISASEPTTSQPGWARPATRKQTAMMQHGMMQ